jgi:cobalt-zinc-cadmium efflux system membrane fusion protein
MVVPNSAVQREGTSTVVFVHTESAEGTQQFTRRNVEIGIKTDEFTEIVSGLEETDTVVTQGSFILRAEVTRRRQTLASL